MYPYNTEPPSSSCLLRCCLSINISLEVWFTFWRWYSLEFAGALILVTPLGLDGLCSEASLGEPFSVMQKAALGHSPAFLGVRPSAFGHSGRTGPQPHVDVFLVRLLWPQQDLLAQRQVLRGCWVHALLFQDRQGVVLVDLLPTHVRGAFALFGALGSNPKMIRNSDYECYGI